MPEKVFVYRYEDEKGFGPFFNSGDGDIEFVLNNWRYGFLTLKDLQEYLDISKEKNSENYKLYKYQIMFPLNETYKEDDKEVKIQFSDNEVKFNLDWVISKEEIK